MLSKVISCLALASEPIYRWYKASSKKICRWAHNERRVINVHACTKTEPGKRNGELLANNNTPCNH